MASPGAGEGSVPSLTLTGHPRKPTLLFRTLPRARTVEVPYYKRRYFSSHSRQEAHAALGP